jgi:hypothetical protein
LVAPDVEQVFLPLRGARAAVLYQPRLLVTATVRFADAKLGVDQIAPLVVLAELSDNVAGVDWDTLADAGVAEGDLETQPVADAQWAEVPAGAAKAKSYAGWKKDVADALFRTRELELRRSPALGVVSKPGESERDFRIRLATEGREERDRQVDALRERFAPKVAALQERIRKAASALDREKSQSTEQKFSAALSIGATVLGSLFGRGRLTANKAATAARGVGKVFGEAGDVGRAEENVGALTQQLEALQADLQTQTQAVNDRADPTTTAIETLAVRPKKTGVEVRRVALAWAPYRRQDDGSLVPSWQ